jgi:hypothetical protein
MNTNSIEFFLAAAAVGIINLVLFIFLRSRLLNFFKAPDLARVPVKISSPENMRRRTRHRPTIICSLPIHQQARPEMPLY